MTPKEDTQAQWSRLVNVRVVDVGGGYSRLLCYLECGHIFIEPQAGVNGERPIGHCEKRANGLVFCPCVLCLDGA